MMQSTDWNDSQKDILLAINENGEWEKKSIIAISSNQNKLHQEFRASDKRREEQFQRLTMVIEGLLGEQMQKNATDELKEENRAKQQARDEQKRKDELATAKDERDKAHELKLEELKLKTAIQKTKTTRLRYIIGGASAVIIAIIETLTRIEW